MNPTGIIRAILVANTTVNTAIGGRIYAGTLPQLEIYPAIRITAISVRGNETKNGPSTNDRWMVQVDTYATTLGETVSIDKAIRSALDYYEGTIAVPNDAHYLVDKIVFDTTRDGLEQTKDLYSRSTDYMLMINNLY